MMTQDDLQYLSPQAQEAYMAFVRRFESEDWKSLVEWAEEQAASAGARQLASQSWDQFLVSKGTRQAFQEIVNLETTIENQFTALVQEARVKEIAVAEEEHE